MPRITCRQPSTGKPINITVVNVPIVYTTIVEAPDFSVPDPSATQYVDRDPNNAARGIAAGQVFCLTPLVARNKNSVARWIEVRLITEAGIAVDAMGRYLVPAGETVAIPMQGRSLVKRVAAGANGERLQVRAEAANTFDLWMSVSEQASDEHVGVL
jgi:hypothetical protein